MTIQQLLVDGGKWPTVHGPRLNKYCKAWDDDDIIRIIKRRDPGSVSTMYDPNTMELTDVSASWHLR